LDNQLPIEKVNKLLPALSLIAERICIGNIPDRHTLEEILLSVGVEREMWALEELGLWSKILEPARNASDDIGGNAIVAELEDRGIPKFSAILAVNEASPKPLSVEPQHIDFGCLMPGEGANATLQVSGGLVRATVSSDYLKLTLLKKDSGITLVKVMLSSGSKGETLQDNIILQGEINELRVLVTARWEKVADESPLLSWCPLCAEKIKKKSLFYNRFARKYECFYCKQEFPYPDKRISLYNDSHG